MTDLELVLEFPCANCSLPMRVTLRCQGRGLLGKPRAAVVELPCPCCTQPSELVFEPATGRIRGVCRPTRSPYGRPTAN